MTHFALDHSYAFEDTVGGYGANRHAYQEWLKKITAAAPALLAQPQREAETILSLPGETRDLAEIEATAAHISTHFNTLVIAGMGGSSLSGATLAALRITNGMRLCFLDNVDPHSMDEVIQSLDWAHTGFLIISKSGNTLETLAQSAVLLRHAASKVKDIAHHFFVVTIPDGNMLHTLAQSHRIKVIPHCPKLGGRFSILSAVGLIPAAAIGMDIRALRAGAQSVLANYESAAQSAALQRALMEKNTRINVIMHYGDRLSGLADWYRQCWGESLGKCGQATTPVRARGTTDQHSQLQLYLDGPKDKFFTFITMESKGQGETIGFGSNPDPRLAFMKGHTLGDLMVAEQHATISSLVQRGCPVRQFSLRKLNEETLGALLMHFSLEIMFTANLLGVNAFDQPAVEDSKVFALEYLAGKD